MNGVTIAYEIENALRDLQSGDVTEAELAAARLVGMGDTAVPVLVKLLKDTSNPLLALVLADILAEIGTQAVWAAVHEWKQKWSI